MVVAVKAVVVAVVTLWVVVHEKRMEGGGGGGSARREGGRVDAAYSVGAFLSGGQERTCWRRKQSSYTLPSM